MNIITEPVKQEPEYRQSLGIMFGSVNWVCLECGKHVTADIRPNQTAAYEAFLERIFNAKLCSECIAKSNI